MISNKSDVHELRGANNGGHIGFAMDPIVVVFGALSYELLNAF